MGVQRAVFYRRQLQFPPRYQLAWKIDTDRIRLQILSCSRMKEKHQEPEVPGEGAPVEGAPVEDCIDGLARITSKELAITHFVKGGSLQNACSTRPRVVAGLGKSALMHTIRLMNSLVKGPKRMMTRVQ